MKYYFLSISFFSFMLMNTANCSEEDEKRCLDSLDKLTQSTKILQGGSKKINKMHELMTELEDIALDSSKKLKGQGEEIESLLDKSDRLGDEVWKAKEHIDNMTCGGWCYTM